VTREEIVRPLFRHDEHAVAAAAAARADDTARRAAFGATLPEDDDKPRHLAVQINRAPDDLLLADRDTLLFGEDVARKGGVYNVTTDLVALRRRPRVQHPARRAASSGWPSAPATRGSCRSPRSSTSPT
jgi:2-oxoisovalerate dehydrogenase E1 component